MVSLSTIQFESYTWNNGGARRIHTNYMDRHRTMYDQDENDDRGRLGLENCCLWPRALEWFLGRT